MKMKSWIKWPLWILIGVMVLIILLLIFGPMIAVPFINRAASSNLNASAGIGGLTLNLLYGKAGIRNLRVEQPAGFATNRPLLSVNRLRADVDVGSLKEQPLVVQRVWIADLAADIQRNTGGVLNAQALVPSPDVPPEAEEEPEGPAGMGGAGGTPEPPPEMNVALIREVDLENWRIFYTDKALASDPVLIHLSDVYVRMTNLLVKTGGRDDELSSRLSLEGLIQQGETDPAFLGLVARTGSVGDDIPVVRSALRLVGFDLKQIGAVLPPGVMTTLGGRLIDVEADMTMHPTNMNLAARIRTASAIYRLSVTGDPKKPTVKLGEALGNIAGRLGGTVGNLAGNTLSAGAEVAGATIKTVGEAGKGLGKVAQSLGSGLAKSATSLAKGDIKNVGKGLADAATGTVMGAVGTVTGTAGEAIKGGVKATKDVTGMKMHEDWAAGTRERWDTQWEEARAWVDGD